MCWDTQSLYIGFSVATLGIITLALIAVLPWFNTTRTGQAVTLGGGFFASVFFVAPLLGRWLRIGDGAMVVCALVIALLLIVPPINTTRRRRLTTFVGGVAAEVAITLVIVQIAQRTVTPTCIPL